ncbi:LysR family transcriptional regulator ArgP [Promicromonospora iranensis]|uniref:LysR family transcriptional regulator (Chromosome initiation inhibitor) n=1 Tax=Promicromonospora iranensis TaxID=1105144 RepID=A0ABU2CL10_9MICO|nr:LysR family transcriptional regulator ArgP [Promicromonospora iranensis]MDR7382016.1 LysR family transcriptional regulator (chromosome initiation inhibitor) [Promicromonospora iranensis]
MRWDSRQLEALAAVVAEGSFDAAARALHVTPSAVSQRIRALENAAGSVLVRRARPVVATTSGQALLRLARQTELLGAEVAAELGADDERPGGQETDSGRPDTLVTVPLAVSADSLATWVLAALAQVDGVTFDLHRADDSRTADLLREGVVMAAVTSQTAQVQGCRSTPLGIMRYRPACTRAFARRWFPHGPTREALDAAPVVVFDRTDDLQDRYLRERAPDARPPRHHVPSTVEYEETIRLGLGWGMLLDRPTIGGLHDGTGGGITLLEPDAVLDIPLHLQQWKLRSTVLDRVTAALRKEATRELLPA